MSTTVFSPGSMDPQKLLYLVEIFDKGSLKKAAKGLEISQPALSKSMGRLEASLGVKLFDRTPTGISPTAFGEILYSHARSIKGEMERAQSRLTSPSEGSEDVIRIGVLPSLASSIIPIALGRLERKRELALLQVSEAVQIDLLIGLEKGDFDFVVGQTEYYNHLDGIRQRVVFRDRLQVFARAKHPIFEKNDISWSDLAELSWVCPMVVSQRTVLENIFTSQGRRRPPGTIECSSLNIMMSLVLESDYLAMMPEHAVVQALDEGKLKPVPVSAPQMSRDIAIIMRDGSTLGSIARELVNHIADVGLEKCQRDIA